MNNWTTMLACLLLSLGLWLMIGLSRSSSAVVDVPVIALSNIPGRSLRSSSETVIVARCKASGFRLLNLRTLSKSSKEVEFAPEDFHYEGQNIFSIESSSMQRYVESVFGPGVEVEAFINPKFSFSFQAEICKKLPVRAVKYISYAPQYMAAGDMVFIPDSVLAYGDEGMLASLDCIQTKPIQLYDVHRVSRGEIGLNNPTALRLSTEEVAYEQPVTRFVEVDADIPLKVKNQPENESLAVFPKYVRARARIVFPVRSEFPGEMECYVDYEDFLASRNGECVIKYSSAPDGLLSVGFTPQVCKCVGRVK